MEQDRGDGSGSGASGGGGSEGPGGPEPDPQVAGGDSPEAAIVKSIQQIMVRGDTETVLFVVIGKDGQSLVELLSSDGADLGKILPIVKAVMEEESGTEQVN